MLKDDIPKHAFNTVPRKQDVVTLAKNNDFNIHNLFSTNMFSKSCFTL